MSSDNFNFAIDAGPSPAGSAPSLARAIDSLNQWQFQVLEAAASINEPFTEKEVVALTEKEAKAALSHLVMVGLIYPSDDGMRLPTQLREVIGAEPAGLGPASMAKLKLSELKDAPADAQKVLERLMCCLLYTSDAADE